MSFAVSNLIRILSAGTSFAAPVGYGVEPLLFFKNRLLRDARISGADPDGRVLKNARLIRNEVLEIFHSTGKQVVLMGHSKGGCDAAAAIALYPREMMPAVAGLITVQARDNVR